MIDKLIRLAAAVAMTAIEVANRGARRVWTWADDRLESK